LKTRAVLKELRFAALGVDANIAQVQRELSQGEAPSAPAHSSIRYSAPFHLSISILTKELCKVQNLEKPSHSNRDRKKVF
jgi:hypothetical protein